MTEVYSAHSKDMALGDGVRYTAFEAEKADGSRLYILVSTQEKRVYFVQITV